MSMFKKLFGGNKNEFFIELDESKAPKAESPAPAEVAPAPAVKALRPKNHGGLLCSTFTAPSRSIE
jgi:hypothetical protein